jgi:hypothetical protein
MKVLEFTVVYSSHHVNETERRCQYSQMAMGRSAGIWFSGRPGRNYLSHSGKHAVSYLIDTKDYIHGVKQLEQEDNQSSPSDFEI